MFAYQYGSSSGDHHNVQCYDHYEGDDLIDNDAQPCPVDSLIIFVFIQLGLIKVHPFILVCNAKTKFLSNELSNKFKF